MLTIKTYNKLGREVLESCEDLAEAKNIVDTHYFKPFEAFIITEDGTTHYKDAAGLWQIKAPDTKRIIKCYRCK